MNKILKLAFIAATSVIAVSASAHPLLASRQVLSDNWVNSTGELMWMNGTGELCWRDAFWTPTTTYTKYDDGALLTQVYDDAPSVPLPAAPGPIITSPKVTYQADILFNFDKAALPAKAEKLDKLVMKIRGLNLKRVVALGYSDKIGSDKYNNCLSLRRAQAVKTYLISKGIPADLIYAEGKGKSNPLVITCQQKNCKPLIVCLAPNRRVEVEVIATTSQPQNKLTLSQLR
ncbi:OmpA family protein [Candidatus Vallotia tarda]|uniref:Outer membrane protein A n=1 Tax=Candidatus Vallotiella hemipterorum TaxID=1177213 RepID=A0A916JSM2_9BURK|nr:OmpA family protein [Candidatus Vallotia tarda]CAG7598109.1 Outer membrane protein A [Candidatus Vallotia tarda]